MSKPASAPDVMSTHELPEEPGKEAIPQGSNATIHRPDPDAEQHPVSPDRKPRSPYVTGND